MIDRLGGITPMDNIQKTPKAQRINGAAQHDSISVSAEAKELAEVYGAMETVAAAPDVRTERVSEVMQKIKDPDYINKSVVDLVADRLMDVYGL